MTRGAGVNGGRRVVKSGSEVRDVFELTKIQGMNGAEAADARVSVARRLEELVAKHAAGGDGVDQVLAEIGELNKVSAALSTRLAVIEQERQVLAAAREAVAAVKGGAAPVDRSAGTPATPKIEMGGRSRLSARAAKVFASVEDGKLAAGFLLAVKAGDHAWFERNARAYDGAQSVMNTRDNPAGGFFVPPAFEATVIKLRDSRGVYRREAMLHQMASDKLPVSKYISGPTAYWVSENPAADVTVSEPVYGQVTLLARKLASVVPATEELINDSAVDIAAQISEDMAYKLADAEDEAAFNGDGTSTYGDQLGIVHLLGLAAHAGSVVTATSQTSVGAVTDAYIQKLRGRLRLHSRNGSKWFASPAVVQELFERLARAAGGVTYREMKDGEGNAEGERLYFAGREVVEVGVMTGEPASGAIAAVLGNLRNGSKFGEVRGGMSLEFNPYYAWLKGGKAWKLQERVAILNHDMGGTTTATAGAICGLKLG